MSEERFGMSGSRTRTDKVGATPSGTSDPITFPTGTYDPGEYRFGMPASMGFGGGGLGSVLSTPEGGTGLYMIPEFIEVDIDFNSSDSEDVVISMGKGVRLVLIGKLYIDEDPGAEFNQWTSFTFYNKSVMRGEHAYYRNIATLAYTDLEVATTGSDANITPDDHTFFASQNVARFIDDGEIARIGTHADTMIAEDIVGAHDIGTGISKISEFSQVTLHNGEQGTVTYLRVEFDAPQTVSLKMELMLVQ